jgi:hypothetical protein
MKLDKRVFLRVKIKSLAAESRIIRSEKRKTNDPDLKQSLNRHRTWDVRNEARATLIAYGYLRGRKFSEVEPLCKNPNFRKLYIMPKVKSMVDKYGNKEQKESYEAWVKEPATIS